MKPSERRKKILDEIDARHDWLEGQVSSGGGTHLSSTDRCQLCGLQRQWSSDTQNGNHGRNEFSDPSGNGLPLLDAALFGCRDEE